MFFIEANAHFFFQSEINCCCSLFFPVPTVVRAERSQCDLESRGWRPLCCGSAQLLGNVFTEVLLWSLMICHPRIPLWGQHYGRSTSSSFHLDIISHSLPCLLAKLHLSVRVADMEHLYYGWWWGSCCSHIVMFQVLTNEFLQLCCSNSRCYLLPGLLTLIAKNLSPAMWKLVEENLCSHFSCFSANSASLCKSSSRI